MKIENNGIYANLYNMQTFHKEDDEDVTDGKEDLEELDKNKKSFKKSKRKNEEIKIDKEEDHEEDIPEQPMSSIYKLNQPELCYNIFGAVVSFLTGCIQFRVKKNLKNQENSGEC